jgi:hypothetical protein
MHRPDTVDLTVEMRSRGPRAFRPVVATVTAVAALLVLAAAAFGLPAFSTAPKSASGGATQAETSSIAVACHPGFDRFVIRLRVGTPGYDVRYVRRVVSDGSGAVVPLLGKKRIRVLLRNTRAHTNTGGAMLPRPRAAPTCAR